MDHPHTLIGSCHNVFVRQMHFAKTGDTEVQHIHQFDHITLLSKGSLEVECNGKLTKFVAPHMIYIKANYVHGMTALEDDTLAYCIHAMTNTHDKNIDDIISPNMIPNGSSYE